MGGEQRVPDEAAALERWMAVLRAATDVALQCDMADRWGGGPSEELAREGERAAARRAEAREALPARVAELRRVAPAIVEAWVAAKQRLLDELLDRLARTPGSDTTAAFVARGERAEWDAVRSGEKPYVEENVVHVHVDRALYRALFGFDP